MVLEKNDNIGQFLVGQIWGRLLKLQRSHEKDPRTFFHEILVGLIPGSL